MNTLHISFVKGNSVNENELSGTVRKKIITNRKKKKTSAKQKKKIK